MRHRDIAPRETRCRRAPQSHRALRSRGLVAKRADARCLSLLRLRRPALVGRRNHSRFIRHQRHAVVAIAYGEPRATCRARIDEADFRAAIDRYCRRRSEEQTSELQSRQYLVCRLLLEKKKTK